MTGRRGVCIHGHFYQPPRENPWIEAIEVQESAAPYHDWNERVTAQCYAPNSAARILNGDGTIRRILNNYSRMSFNVGPTLLSWLETHAPEVYAAILEADSESRIRFSGHGSAIAQAYSHAILPLANPRDKETQVRWGIEDFRHRFGRFPEGLWLPETAVDLPTLEVLAALGIRFTILAPRQIGRTRKIGGRGWVDVTGGRVDPRRPYRVRLPSGQAISVFPYDGPLAHDVSFGALLENGERFMRRLVDALGPASQQPQLVHLATDGEVYGHHKRFGEMALAYVLDRLERGEAAGLTNYGEWLEQHPPTHEAEIIEATSWSCAHGIERWRSDCGCNSGDHPDWDQSWRAPLRQALDHLRDDVARRFVDKAVELFTDPWRARDAYIAVVCDRSTDSVDAFLLAQTTRPLLGDERIAALKLMELQRHAILMYASCGWFFDDVAGIEGVQVLRYAGRVVDLANQLFGPGAEEPFLELLESARSNDPAAGDGRAVYETTVRPSAVSLSGVAAHHALTAPFSEALEHGLFSAYRIEILEREERNSENAFLRVGRIHVTFPVTTEQATLEFAVLHSGGTEIIVGVREARSLEDDRAVGRDLLDTFEHGSHEEAAEKISNAFAGDVYSLHHLFREEQRRMLDGMMQKVLGEIETAYRAGYERAEPLLQLLAELAIPLPRPLKTLATFMLNVDLKETAAEAPFDRLSVDALFRQAEEWGIALDRTELAYHWSQGLESATQALAAEPSNLEAIEGFLASVVAAHDHEVPVDLWRAQNAYYHLAEGELSMARQRAGKGDPAAAEWLTAVESLGRVLGVDDTGGES